MLNRINTLLADNQSFAFETTLSTRSYKNKVLHAQQKGYTVTLLFFWLQTVDLAKERVKSRVAEGGHNIEPDVIERRYVTGIHNLFTIYLPIVDGAFIFDNSTGRPELIAQKTISGEVTVFDALIFDKLKRCYDHG